MQGVFHLVTGLVSSLISTSLYAHFTLWLLVPGVIGDGSQADHPREEGILVGSRYCTVDDVCEHVHMWLVHVGKKACCSFMKR